MTPELRERLRSATDLKAWSECCGLDDCEECCRPDTIYVKALGEINPGDHVTITGRVPGMKSLADVIADDVASYIEGEWPELEGDLHGAWVFPEEIELDVEIVRAAVREMVAKAIPQSARILARFEKVDAPTLQALREIIGGGQ